jgi:sugar phosphate isomerase/epimerase
MRTAYSTNAYTRHDLGTAVARIAALGFDGVEILCDHPHWFPAKADDAAIEQMAERLRDLGLGVSNLNANTACGYFDPVPPETVFEPSLSSADAERRRWRLEYSVAAVDFAARVGARNISVTSGRPDSGGSPAQGATLFVDSLKRLCEAAARHEIRIGVEYEPGLLVERATELAAVIEEVDSPLLGANLDIGHAYLAGETPEQTVALLAGRIWNLHIEDIAHHKHFHLVPGDGDLPLARWLDTLAAGGYDGWHTVELYTYPQAPDAAGSRALTWLQTYAGRAMPTAPDDAVTPRQMP